MPQPNETVQRFPAAAYTAESKQACERFLADALRRQQATAVFVRYADGQPVELCAATIHRTAE